MMRAVRRMLTLCACVAVVGLVGAGCSPGPAPDQPDPSISCASVTGAVTYSPPAVGVAVDTTLTVSPNTQISACSTPAGTPTGGVLTGSFLLPGFRCGGGTFGTQLGAGTGQIEWDDGGTSQYEAVLRNAQLSGFAVELTVTGGDLDGARGTLLMKGTTSDGNCTPAQPLSTLNLVSNRLFDLHPAPEIAFGPRSDVAQVAAGQEHSCAALTSGFVRCWGRDTAGQLGNLLVAPGATVSVPVEVTGLGGVAEVSAGIDHTCARLATGQVRCWGSDRHGKLGTGTSVISSRLPLPVSGLAGATQVDVGSEHSCALSGGSVWCWGANDVGQLGDGTFVSHNAPVQVAGLTDAVQISIGGNHGCALRAGGPVVCWGSNGAGQLGDGTTSDRATPAAVPGSTGATQVAAGGEHTCALGGSGNVVCWGSTRFGQLGIESTSDLPVTEPRLVQATLAATEISAGEAHTCAIVTGGSVSCWGAGSTGQLGDGLTLDSNLPLLVFGERGATRLSAGGGHTCALRGGGTVACWGANDDGQLGNGTTTLAVSTLPVSVVNA